MSSAPENRSNAVTPAMLRRWASALTAATPAASAPGHALRLVEVAINGPVTVQIPASAARWIGDALLRVADGADAGEVFGVRKSRGRPRRNHLFYCIDYMRRRAAGQTRARAQAAMKTQHGALAPSVDVLKRWFSTQSKAERELLWDFVEDRVYTLDANRKLRVTRRGIDATALRARITKDARRF